MAQDPLLYVACATVACEQALLGALAAGREKEGSLQLCLWNLNILHRKSQCEMLIGRDGINNDVNMLAHFCFTLIGGNMKAQLMGSHRGIGGGIHIPEM